jgi:CheY-like chemotaxis protein
MNIYDIVIRWTGFMKKIMVIDDEPDQIYVIKKSLEKAGVTYEIITANSGAQCLELLEKNQIPDLILLDIMMPEMSGWTVFDKLKDNATWEKIPIIFLTARTDRIAVNAGGFLGNDFIEKPFDAKDLMSRIDKVLKDTNQK